MPCSIDSESRLLLVVIPQREVLVSLNVSMSHVMWGKRGVSVSGLFLMTQSAGDLDAVPVIVSGLW